MLEPYLIELMKQYGTNIVFITGLLVIMFLFSGFWFLLRWKIKSIEDRDKEYLENDN